jgi:hypothetical protein
MMEEAIQMAITDLKELSLLFSGDQIGFKAPVKVGKKG